MEPSTSTTISRRRGAALGAAVGTPIGFAVWLAFGFDAIGLLLGFASLAAGPISGATRARGLITARGALPVLTAGVHAVAAGLGAVAVAAIAISVVVNPDRAAPRELVAELGLFILFGLGIFGLPALVVIAIPALLVWRALARRILTESTR